MTESSKYARLDERLRDRRAILEKTKQDIWTIWYAAEHGKADRARTLLDRHAVHVDVQEPRMRWTALHFAARFAKEDVVRVLLEFHANPDAVDKDGNTPLHLCAGYGSFRCCVVLLEGGADTQCLNADQCSALDVAVKMDHREIVQLLRSWVPVELTRAAPERIAKQERVAAFVMPEDQDLRSREPEPIYLEVRALRCKEEALGLHHPGIVGTLCKLATMYRKSQRAGDAIVSLRRAIAISELHYGEDAMDTAILRNNLAGLLFCFRDHATMGGDEAVVAPVEECVGLLLRALQVMADSKSFDAEVCLENLCICLQYSSQHAIADGYMHQLLARFSATYGTDHEKVLGLQQAIATKYIAQKRFDEGLALMDTCLRITRHKFGLQHRAVAHCHDTIGRAHFVRGDFKTAELEFQKSLHILLVLYDAAHTDIIRGHNNIAVVALAQQNEVAVRGQLDAHI
ncbi:Aste57867_24272 [Aphanomyces stellatus]|uniref:Aste57867_24272 protein n=1 Tax=Aphanomyces stellatus TaxID=120398 RepID=A0A485LQ86_9STRA|nr:hypothetical protein As57867_024197 [Aphanomyces stellatus]VFU00912.1 Aste57867_24272 [Aphanomyces stellatus]